MVMLDPKEIATLYRSLRKALEDSKDEPGAGDLYYGEMEMRRRSDRGAASRERARRRDCRRAGESRFQSRRHRRPRLVTRTERRILEMYWLVSGYGLRAGRALAALLVLITVSTAAFHLYGFRDRVRPYAAKTDLRPQPSIGTPAARDVVDGLQSLEAWTYSVGTATAIVGTPDAQLTQTGRTLRIVLRILSPLLLGLALLAIRGRVKR